MEGGGGGTDIGNDPAKDRMFAGGVAGHLGDAQGDSVGVEDLSVVVLTDEVEP